MQCDESEELVNDQMKCTIPLRSIFMRTHFTFGDIVQAQIADVHDGNVESELSELGGTAVIPGKDTFIGAATSLRGVYSQITLATRDDENPVH